MQPSLPDDVVEVRWLEPDAVDAAYSPRLLNRLEPAERQRAERFHFAHDRQAYVVAHVLARTMLSRHFPRPPEAWRFKAGPHGKPEVEDGSDAPPLRFNLSHTRGLVAVAISRRHDIGVDVELLDSRRLGLDLAARAFAPAEVDHLRGLPEESRAEAAFAFWTLKEAYIKAIGLGLACPLDAFAFQLEPLSIRFSPPILDDPAQWLFLRLQPTSRHRLALALRHPWPTAVRVDAGPMPPAALLGWSTSADHPGSALPQHW